MTIFEFRHYIIFSAKQAQICVFGFVLLAKVSCFARAYHGIKISYKTGKVYDQYKNKGIAWILK